MKSYVMNKWDSYYTWIHNNGGFDPKMMIMVMMIMLLVINMFYGPNKNNTIFWLSLTLSIVWPLMGWSLQLWGINNNFSSIIFNQSASLISMLLVLMMPFSSDQWILFTVKVMVMLFVQYFFSEKKDLKLLVIVPLFMFPCHFYLLPLLPDIYMSLILRVTPSNDPPQTLPDIGTVMKPLIEQQVQPNSPLRNLFFANMAIDNVRNMSTNDLNLTVATVDDKLSGFMHSGEKVHHFTFKEIAVLHSFMYSGVSNMDPSSCGDFGGFVQEGKFTRDGVNSLTLVGLVHSDTYFHSTFTNSVNEWSSTNILP